MEHLSWVRKSFCCYQMAHSTQPVAAVKLHVDVRALKKDISRQLRLIDKYRAEFADSPYIEVLYESFVQDREQETRRVLQFLGIDEFVSLSTNLVKLNPDSLDQIIENYQEVAQALQGTAYAKYLSI